MSLLFSVKRKLASTLRRLLSQYLDKRTYVVRHGLAAGLKRRGGIGFIKRPLSKEEAFVQQLDLRGRVVYDIGAYQGEYTLFLARAVGPDGCVVTFEPNPDNYHRVLENVALNGFRNVRVLNIALGDRTGVASLTFRPSERAAGSIEQHLADEMATSKEAKTLEVRIETLDSLIQRERLPIPDFVKIDVEGLEFDVLTGMAETISSHSPALFIEIHGAGMERKVENAQRVVERVTRDGYTVVHVESDSAVTTANAAVAREGHVFCRAIKCAAIQPAVTGN